MLKFRKKPIVIEAFQMTAKAAGSRAGWPKWLYEAWEQGAGEGGLWADPDNPDNPEQLVVGTLEGVHHVTWDDWIIQGVKGELYPCKPDIFDATYEAVE